MSKNTKRLISAIVVALILVAGFIGFKLNKVNTNSNEKNFTIVVESERDDFSKTLDCKSDLGTLGEYVRTLEDCTYSESEYGIYITGWYGYEEDTTNQFWWSVSVDGEMASTGADGIELVDGQSYEFILKEGW